MAAVYSRWRTDPSFSQALPGFATESATGAALRDGPWRELFVPSRPFAAGTSATTTVAEADPQSQSAAPPPAEPQHTGFQALVRTVGSDFVAFPKRRSTWVILGIGAGGALLALPVDDDVNAKLVGSEAVGRFFAPGKVIGSAWVQIGASVGLYVVGRYVMPHKEGEGKTNKVSHLGYDLLRAQIVSQAFVHGIKYTVQRDRPTGECCSFPSGHAATAFAAASVLERHLGYRAAWPTLVVGRLRRRVTPARQPPFSERRDLRIGARHGYRLDDCWEARPVRLRAAADAGARGVRVERDAGVRARGLRFSKV